MVIYDLYQCYEHRDQIVMRVDIATAEKLLETFAVDAIKKWNGTGTLIDYSKENGLLDFIAELTRVKGEFYGKTFG